MREDSSSVDKARADGLDVLPIADAASRGDVVMVLLPDEKQAEIWEAEIADGLTVDEQVVTNPGERLADGIEVQVRTAEKKDGTNGKVPQATAR